MKHDVLKNLTVYIISCKRADSVVNALKKTLRVAMEAAATSTSRKLPLKDPFEIHSMLSSLSCDTSKFHVKRFRRFMWTQLNAVDEQLARLDSADRKKLRALTKEL